MYDFPIPDGMAAGQFREHPVTQVLREAAHRDRRGIPSKRDLDALDLKPELRRLVAARCEEVASTFQTGEQEVARNLADKAAAEVISHLPEDRRDPRWQEREAEDDLDDFDPDQLADRIPRP